MNKVLKTKLEIIKQTSQFLKYFNDLVNSGYSSDEILTIIDDEPHCGAYTDEIIQYAIDFNNDNRTQVESLITVFKCLENDKWESTITLRKYSKSGICNVVIYNYKNNDKSQLEYDTEISLDVSDETFNLLNSILEQNKEIKRKAKTLTNVERTKYNIKSTVVIGEIIQELQKQW